MLLQPVISDLKEGFRDIDSIFEHANLIQLRIFTVATLSLWRSLSQGLCLAAFFSSFISTLKPHLLKDQAFLDFPT